MICYVLLCYGGGFGTMPSFILDVFGPARMALAYGVILTAWSAAGIVGPQVVAFLKDHYAEQAASLFVLRRRRLPRRRPAAFAGAASVAPTASSLHLGEASRICQSRTVSQSTSAL